jgi:precorrin-2 dehydrogenase/sirohydrochlorin ferrochelatase
MGKKYYPVNIDVAGKKCLVVGGGAVGERKVRSLLDCGALVTLISKSFTAGLERLADEGKIRAEKRGFDDGDVEGAFLVYCATDDGALNRRVFETADKKLLLVNVVDQPALCNFIVPAVVRKGSLLASVSTSAAAPALAKKLKAILAGAFDDGYAPLLEFLAEKRKAVKTLADDIASRKKIFEGLIESPLSKLFVADARKSEGAACDISGFDFDEYKKSNPEIIAEAEKIFGEVCEKHLPRGERTQK